MLTLSDFYIFKHLLQFKDKQISISQNSFLWSVLYLELASSAGYLESNLIH